MDVLKTAIQNLSKLFELFHICHIRLDALPAFGELVFSYVYNLLLPKIVIRNVGKFSSFFSVKLTFIVLFFSSREQQII